MPYHKIIDAASMAKLFVKNSKIFITSLYKINQIIKEKYLKE